MEENMNTEQTTQTENMGTEGQGTGQKETAGKMFTQDEVNGFVQSRINRMRGQIEKDIKATYDQKLAELDARERNLMVKEQLSERGMPRELADIITCTDKEDLDKKLDALNKLYGTAAAEQKKESRGFVMIGAAPNNEQNREDPIRKAMGLGI